MIRLIVLKTEQKYWFADSDWGTLMNKITQLATTGIRAGVVLGKDTVWPEDGVPDKAISFALCSGSIMRLRDDTGRWYTDESFQLAAQQENARQSELMLPQLEHILRLLRDYGMRVKSWQASSELGAQLELESPEAAECARRLLMPDIEGATVQRKKNCLLLYEDTQSDDADYDRMLQRMGVRDDEALLIEGNDALTLLESIEGRTYGFTTRITPVGW